MSIYETGLEAMNNETLRHPNYKEGAEKVQVQETSAGTKEYQSRVEVMEQRNAERNNERSEEIHFGSSKGTSEMLEEYERLEKKKKQQEQNVKDAEKRFEKTVKAAGTSQGNDYWVDKRKKELESEARNLEKTKKQISDL